MSMETTEKDKTAMAQLRTDEAEAREYQLIVLEKQQNHEIQLREMDNQATLKIKKLEADAATDRLRATTRSDIVRHSFVAFCKILALPLAILFIFILELARHDIPESLDEFIHL